MERLYGKYNSFYYLKLNLKKPVFPQTQAQNNICFTFSGHGEFG